jgi:hypothetical protein
MFLRNTNMAKPVAMALTVSVVLPLFAFIPSVSRQSLPLDAEFQLCVPAPLLDTGSSFDALDRPIAATNLVQDAVQQALLNVGPFGDLSMGAFTQR